MSLWTEPVDFFGIPFPPVDAAALLWFVILWNGYAISAEKMGTRRNNLLNIMNFYRLEWMRAMLRRDNRMMDAAMVGNLQRSIAFFASTTIFIILGLVTLLGYRDKAEMLIDIIPFSAPAPPLLWELKVCLMIVIFIYAFFKYTWSLRQYNYAGIFIAAAPDHNAHLARHEDIARKGAYLVGNAARHFNMGLRAYYFGLAALGWFISGPVFIVATTWMVFIIYRREFSSHTLHNLSGETPVYPMD